MKILTVLILYISLSLSLNELTPDRNNAKLIQEYDMKCETGTITYKINNYQTKKYFHLIKDSFIYEFELFGDGVYSKLSYETSSKFDFFYLITSYKTLYLVIKNSNNYCISFKYSQNNFISLVSNKEYIYPVVAYSQDTEAKIKDV